MIFNILDIVSDFISDDGVNVNNLSDYYDLYEFGKGGIVKAKEIIMNKIGYNEEAADYFIGKSEKFAVWLADSILKEELKFKNYNKKQWLDSNYSSWRIINANYANAIREILDWLQHPITPKQELRQLSFEQALEKAREWHNELQVLGGDIDFTEPNENLILKTYPDSSENIKYYWVYIPSNFCSLESSRMGHCGRTGYGNKIISLRSVKPYGKGHTISDSHVTIAYGENGVFYQVKGKKNQKPSEKYYPYIFDLIKSIIKGDLENYDRSSIQSEIKKIEDAIVKIAEDFKVQDTNSIEWAANVEALNILVKSKKDLENLLAKKDVNLEFNGFGKEYNSSQDYGFEDMSKSELRELYELDNEKYSDAKFLLMIYEKGIISESEIKNKIKSNTEKFNSFTTKKKMYELGLSDKPKTEFIIKEKCADISDLIDTSSDYSQSIIENLLCGDMGELTDSWYYHYNDNIGNLIDDLDEENAKKIIDRIQEITNLDRSTIEENGIGHYLMGEDDDFEEDYFDDIKRSLANAASNGDESDYYNYLYKELKGDLEKYGEVVELNDEGVIIKSDLSDLLDYERIFEIMERIESDDIKEVFSEALAYGDIDKPTFRPDDRYVGSYDIKLFNEYLDIDSYEIGGSVVPKNKLGMIIGKIIKVRGFDAKRAINYVIKKVSLADSNYEKKHFVLNFNKDVEEKVPIDKMNDLLSGEEVEIYNYKRGKQTLKIIK